MAYDEQDAAQEDYLDGLFLNFRAERGQEIADDLDYAEFVTLIVAAHNESWADVDRVCSVAEERLSSGAPEEALFQAARAFETYVISVLVNPVRDVIASRIDRALPSGFSAKPKTVLVSIRGLGEPAMPFVTYSISLMAVDEAQSRSHADRFKAFVGATESPWKRLRNGLLHTTVSVSLEEASYFVAEIRELLSWFHAEGTRLDQIMHRERERADVTPERIEAIAFLAQLHLADASAVVQWHEISVVTTRARMGRERGLRSLLSDGFIEMVDSERFPRHVRITEGGLAFYRDRAKSRLSKQMLNVTAHYVALALENVADRNRAHYLDA